MLWAEISSTEASAQTARNFPSLCISAIRARSSDRFSAESFFESLAPESFRTQAASP